MGKEQSVAFITTRMKSTRLHGKAMAGICGKPLTRHIVDRLRAVKGLDEVVVIPSVDSQEIVDYCEHENIRCLEHHKDYDYLGQLYLGYIVYQPKWIVRIWGDCPFIDPNLIEETLCKTKERHLDYVVPSFPCDGTDFRIMRDRIIRVFALKNAKEKEYFNEVSEDIFPSIIKSPYLYPFKLSVDTQEDLDRVRAIAERLYHKNPLFVVEDIIRECRDIVGYRETGS